MEALGIVEVIGFACAVNVSDVMVKTADVQLIGIERAKGSGWLSVKVVGDVGAVNAAVEAGSTSASVQEKLISSLVIPRLADGLAEVWLKPGLDASTSTAAVKTVAEPGKTESESPKVAPTHSDETTATIKESEPTKNSIKPAQADKAKSKTKRQPGTTKKNKK
ncbi:BMC domain-containing protein [Enterococcus sp. CSURQ0835]|uniref:BMC domain-containing protein n=1 Tax=Enterococcus sp. CSURQ0835 TaxID=2681394 RepID=UPI00135AB303|nr:BMC domain-containing protein [Enterococcus sp. CSURQ0835]